MFLFCCGYLWKATAGLSFIVNNMVTDVLMTDFCPQDINSNDIDLVIPWYFQFQYQKDKHELSWPAIAVSVTVWLILTNCIKWERLREATYFLIYLIHLPLNKMAIILADNIFKCIFLNEKDKILIKISLKLVPRGPIDNKPALVLEMVWRRTGDKPLPEPMMAQFTDACMWH